MYQQVNTKEICSKCVSFCRSQQVALTHFEMRDRRAHLHHTPCCLVAQHHRLGQHKVSDSAVLPVVDV